MLRRRSATSAPPEPVFFTDRDLGKSFPAFLRSHGLLVEPYHEHFKRQMVPDRERLSFVGERNWIAVTHDRNIRYKTVEVDTLMVAGVKAFVIIGAAPHLELAEAFVKAASSLRDFVHSNPAPFIAKVYKRDSSVKMWLTLEAWKERRQIKNRRRRR